MSEKALYPGTVTVISRLHDEANKGEANMFKMHVHDMCSR